jgi:cobalamin biosynthesis protein CbiG
LESADGGRVVIGLGARPGVPEEELTAAIGAGLAAAGLRPADVAALATLDRRAREPAVRAVAVRFGWPLVSLTAEDLAAVEVPHPSGMAAAAVGTPSVAEAAALRAAAPGAVLILPKRAFPRATVAIARGRPDATSHA